MTERWHTEQVDDITYLVMRGTVLAGSINWKVDQWHVEIMWGDGTGDITFRSADYISALSFIEGVEQTLAKFTRGTECPTIAPEQ